MTLSCQKLKFWKYNSTGTSVLHISISMPNFKRIGQSVFEIQPIKKSQNFGEKWLFLALFAHNMSERQYMALTLISTSNIMWLCKAISQVLPNIQKKAKIWRKSGLILPKIEILKIRQDGHYPTVYLHQTVRYEENPSSHLWVLTWNGRTDGRTPAILWFPIWVKTQWGIMIYQPGGST